MITTVKTKLSELKNNITLLSDLLAFSYDEGKNFPLSRYKGACKLKHH